jgi:hypothetical protein
MPHHPLLKAVIEMDHRKIGCKNLHWINMSLNRIQWRLRMNIVVNLRLNFLTGKPNIRFLSGNYFVEL